MTPEQALAEIETELEYQITKKAFADFKENFEVLRDLIWRMEGLEK